MKSELNNGLCVHSNNFTICQCANVPMCQCTNVTMDSIKMRNPVVEKSIDVALLIIQYCELLESSRKYVIARQLLKAVTSIGANIHEAQNAESKADFIHKMKIAAKELEKTK